MSSRSARNTLCALVLAPALAACGIVPFSTQMKLRNFDPLTFDPAEPRAIILLTEKLRIVPSGAKIRLSHWHKDQPDRKSEDIFTLQEVAEAPPQAIMGAAKTGEWATVFRLRPEDQSRIRKLQAEFAERKRTAPDSYVSEVKADVSACHVMGFPQGRITGTLYLKPDQATGYLPVIESIDLADLAKSAGKTLEEEIRPCRPSKAG